MNVQTTLMKSRTLNCLLETRAVVSHHYRKEEDIVNEIEPAASSTLSKGRRTAISKHVKAMAPLHPIHDMRRKTS